MTVSPKRAEATAIPALCGTPPFLCATATHETAYNQRQECLHASARSETRKLTPIALCYATDRRAKFSSKRSYRILVDVRQRRLHLGATATRGEIVVISLD